MTMKIFYIVYKTTNLINGKFYVGIHRTPFIDDGYMGSGKLLKRAIKKYGIDNFHKEILFICSSEQEMSLREKILVVPDPEISYNLVPGGYGGWNKNLPMEENTKEILRKVNLGKKHTRETKDKIAKSKIGKSLSEITKGKMSISQTGIKRFSQTKNKIAIQNAKKLFNELNILFQNNRQRMADHYGISRNRLRNKLHKAKKYLE